MAQVALFGKSEIKEKLAWCKKFSNTTDEKERFEKARLEVALDNDTLLSCSDPALDQNKIGQKLKDLGLTFPSSEEFEAFNSKLFKDIKVFALFNQYEDVPGLPIYEYGIGFKVETYNIFLEENIHDEVEVEVKQSGLFKKTVKQKERRLKKIDSVFGADFSDEKFVMAATGREKDSRENTRYGLRFTCNATFSGGPDKMVPEKLDHKWKDETTFFESFIKTVADIQKLVNQTFTTLGYETAPEYTLLLGGITPDLKVGKFTKDEVDGQLVIDVEYE